MEATYDVIVIGVGSMGSATCYQLARRGLRVLGLERFSVPNEMGSHAGQSRIIRKAYFEHPDYVPLLHRSYEGWSALEASSGVKLYHETGLLYAGGPTSALLKGVRESAELHHIPLESIPAGKRSNRFPAFQIGDDYDLLFEPNAGFIVPDLAITTFVKGAERAGAVIRQHERVINWKSDGSGVSVITESGHYKAAKLVITAGPWAYDLIPELKTLLKVTRQLFAWFMPERM
ncbi:MAG: N-methyl-L-tryptophan oxidase, partial [Bacteroidota bacterium]